jgi:D-arabinitol 4-dehydrogenase
MPRGKRRRTCNRLPAASNPINAKDTDMQHERESAGAQAPVILHIGIGSFHRAHQAWYLHRLIEQGLTDWSLAASSIRNDMVPLLECLERQNGTYTLETVTPHGVREYELIRSIRRVVPWDPELAALIDVGAQPNTRIISFTVTEGGYYLDQHHHLDPAHPDLAADLAGGRRTIYGAIGAVLRARLERGTGPVTLMNCDNLRSNGERFRGGMLEFLDRRGEHELKQFVLEQTTCPSSMVDRITPRPLADVAARVREATGFDDACPVMGESFIQWVIEDDFRAGRPAWEKVGAEMVDSVLPYEEAKIRILNASHSCIAWAGTLVGLEFIHEGTNDDEIRKMAYDYVTDDVIPCLSPSPLDLAAYRDVVLDRFSNPYIKDTNQRVTADGYSKIPGFIVPTLSELLARHATPAATAMLPALYYLFLMRWHRGELPYAYQDGVMDPAAAHAMLDQPDPLGAFCAERQLWGTITGNTDLEAAIRSAVARAEVWLASRG